MPEERGRGVSMGSFPSSGTTGQSRKKRGFQGGREERSQFRAEGGQIHGEQRNLVFKCSETEVWGGVWAASMTHSGGRTDTSQERLDQFKTGIFQKKQGRQQQPGRCRPITGMLQSTVAELKEKGWADRRARRQAN